MHKKTKSFPITFKILSHHVDRNERIDIQAENEAERLREDVESSVYRYMRLQQNIEPLPIPRKLGQALTGLLTVLTHKRTFDTLKLPDTIRDQLKQIKKKLQDPKTSATAKETLQKSLIAVFTTLLSYPSIQLMITQKPGKGKEGQVSRAIKQYVHILKTTPYKGFSKYAPGAGLATTGLILIPVLLADPIKEKLAEYYAEKGAEDHNLEMESKLVAGTIATLATVKFATAARNKRMALGMGEVPKAAMRAGTLWGIPRDILMSQMNQAENPIQKLIFALFTAPPNTASQEAAKAAITKSQNPFTQAQHEAQKISQQPIPELKPVTKLEKPTEKAFFQLLKVLHKGSHNLVKGGEIAKVFSRVGFGGVAPRMIHLSITCTALKTLQTMAKQMEVTDTGDTRLEENMKVLTARLQTIQRETAAYLQNLSDAIETGHREGLTLEEVLNRNTGKPRITLQNLDSLTQKVTEVVEDIQIAGKKFFSRIAVHSKRTRVNVTQRNSNSGDCIVGASAALVGQMEQTELRLRTHHMHELSSILTTHQSRPTPYASRPWHSSPRPASLQNSLRNLWQRFTGRGQSYSTSSHMRTSFIRNLTQRIDRPPSHQTVTRWTLSRRNPRRTLVLGALGLTSAAIVEGTRRLQQAPQDSKV